MCGIAGIVDLQGGAVVPGAIESLTALIAHRGPDGAGFWHSDDKRIALGHRRLAIIDPGARGNQPMISGDGRYVIVYNGEIYNFLELRQELEALGIAYRIRHRGDTRGVAGLGAGDAAALQRHVGICHCRQRLRRCFSGA